MTSTAQALPHWDMSVVYPGLDSPEFASGFEQLVERVGALATLFDLHRVAKLDERAPLDDVTVVAFDEVIGRYNALLADVRTMGSYISAFISTNSRDDLAQAKMSELQGQMVRVSQLDTRFTAWVGSLDVDGLVQRSEPALSHEFALRQAQTEALHQMSPAEEELAAELSVSAGTAWGKLYNSVSSQIAVPLEPADGAGPRELPMSAVRNLAYDPDRETRRRTYEAEMAAWEQHAVPLAAALNSIKGQVNTLSRKRGWESPLDEALFENHIDRQTLDAMLSAARESFPDFRRYLRAKARALGLADLAWYDLFAPLDAGEGGRDWSWEASRDFIIAQFGDYSPKLGEFAERAYREQWIDAEPRPGKRDGAFCMGLRADESRIMTNFKPAYAGMRTMAHELGHAYHNLCKAGRSPIQQVTPMALAETASIFCETITRDAALEGSTPQEQLAILEASLQGQCQVVVDITSRYLFEQHVFDARRGRELSVSELNEIMVDAQRQTYGDGLDGKTLHPFMWAAKSHYYSAGRSFYNYPYMFGLLFGLGLFARYRADPDGFRAGYDELLSATGMADAATLAAGFDIDIRTPDFWRASLDVIRADIARFEQLID